MIEIRSRRKGFDTDRYVSCFSGKYRSIPKKLNQSVDEYLAEVEAETDKAMMERKN